MAKPKKTARPIVEETLQEPPAVKRELSKSRLDADLSERLRRPVKGYCSQGHTDYEYGYSWVRIPGLGDYGYSSVSRAIGRMEGDAGDFPRTATRTIDFASDSWYEQLLGWMEFILQAGRTVECGPGAGILALRRANPRGQTCDVGLSSLVDEIRRGVLQLNPDYQRGAVWTDEQAARFVGHWLEGGEVPRIWVQRWDSGDNVTPGDLARYKVGASGDWNYLPQEVVDGQQRLRAIYRWRNGEIAAEMTDGQRVTYSQTNEVERRGFSIQLTYIDLPRVERLRLYLRLNRGGTVHTDEEIARVREMLARETAT
jgi:hypothetical protein